jgi:hypothetical protein
MHSTPPIVLLYIDKLFSSDDVFNCEQLKDCIESEAMIDIVGYDCVMYTFKYRWNSIFYDLLNIGFVRIDMRSMDYLTMNYIDLMHKECILQFNLRGISSPDPMLNVINLYTFKEKISLYFSKKLVNYKMFDQLI